MAQKMAIYNLADMEKKKALAKSLAGLE